jgi:signal transduction histidine kinase
MRRWRHGLAPGRLAGWLAAVICVSVAILIWFSYRAVQEWESTQELLADRRAQQTVDLFVTALSRDMRGVQDSILSTWWDQLMLEAPDDVRSAVASAFERYPYPESFFAWRRASLDDRMAFFNRSDRRPPWMPADEGKDRFPVSIAYPAMTARAFLDRIHADAAQGRRFSVFDMPLADSRYQVVARLFYRDSFRDKLEGIVGFTVNLRWAREHYFPEVARQVARIGNGLSLAVVDESGKLVWGTTRGTTRGPSVRRWFPVMFFDPLLVGVDLPVDLARQSWAVQADISGDEAMSPAMAGAKRTLLIAAAATATLILGLLLTARASRASARLAGMRSEFVSSVTHELKTPIATIRAIGETVARGRVSDPRALQEYAQLVVQEARRLTRLVENLLAYARVTDMADVYAFEPLVLYELVEDALKGFRVPLSDAGFDLDVDVPPDVPAIRADRTAMGLLLDNIIDNAIRYSTTRRSLHIRARCEQGGKVLLAVSDRGVGIPREELDHVTRRFFRGSDAPSSGSGLGLAIVKRIAEDHKGTLTIESAVGEGTTVTVTIPAVEGDHEAADSRR